jgi:hypothetical protein
MGKKSRQKKARRNEPHPTIFVLDGTIQHFPDGSMMELYTGVTPDEWQEIVISSVQFKIFLDCLKDVACPLLHEVWTKEDEWYRLMLEHNISRMRNLDPMIFLPIDQDEIKRKFEDKIRTQSIEVAADIKKFRDQHYSFLGERSDHSSTDVSEL